MLKRFCFYSFLKDQRYVEPFLLLALAEKGWSFGGIGVLLGLRDAAVAVLEVPTGVLADGIGYRKTLVLAFLSCMIGYAMLGASAAWVISGMGAIALGAGEACRTGVHKAMILNWLARHGQSEESARYYGYTRSWGEIGSAVSVLIAAVIVLSNDSYHALFFATLAPFVMNIANTSNYPGDVEPVRHRGASLSLIRSLVRPRQNTVSQPVFRIMTQSVAFDSLFRSTKYYLQPAIELMTASLFVGWTASQAAPAPKVVAIVAVPVFVVLHLLSAIASQQAHRASTMFGGVSLAMRVIWMVAAMCYLAIAVAGLGATPLVIVMAFILLHGLQNLWRPLVITELSRHLETDHAATWLSTENLLRKAGAAALLPLLGMFVDWAGQGGQGKLLWPVGVLGFCASLTFFIWRRRDEEEPGPRQCAWQSMEQIQ